MKKLNKIFGLVLIAALTVIMTVCFAACGDKDKDEGGKTRPEWTTYAGTYKFSRFEQVTTGSPVGTVTNTYNVGDEVPYVGLKYTEEYMIIELKSDGTAKISADSSVGVSSSGTTEGWYVEDGKLLFDNSSAQGAEYLINDSKIEFVVTITQSGMTTTTKIIMVKAK